MGASCSSPTPHMHTSGITTVATTTTTPRANSGRVVIVETSSSNTTNATTAPAPATTTRSKRNVATGGGSFTDFDDDAGHLPSATPMMRKKKNAFEDLVGSGMVLDEEIGPVCFVLVGALHEVSVTVTLPALRRLFLGQLVSIGSYVLAVELLALNNNTKHSEHVAAKQEEEEENNDGIVHCSAPPTLEEFRANVENNLALHPTTNVAMNRRLIFVFSGCDSHEQLALLTKAAKSIPSEWSRAVLVPPFGSTIEEFSQGPWTEISRLFGEQATFFVNQHAVSDITRRVVALRFGNRPLEPTWNRNHVRAVLVDFATSSVVGPDVDRVMTEHLIDLAALVAMERPASRFGNDIRLAKTEALKHLRLTGSYDACKHEGVAKVAKPSMLTVVLEFDTNRWRGVPFVLRVGRGLAEDKCEVRVLYWRAVGADRLWNDQRELVTENELVIYEHPRDHASIKLVTNSTTGLATRLASDVAVVSGDHDIRPCVPEPYVRLLYEVSRGKLASFASLESLSMAKATLSPLIQEIGTTKPLGTYAMGSHLGAPSSNALVIEHCGGSCPWGNPHHQSFKAWSLTCDSSLLRRLELDLFVSPEAMHRMVRRVSVEMIEGLAGRSSTIKMLPSFVTSLPTGFEQGSVIALDMGGTNFRVSRFVLLPGARPRCTHETHYPIPLNLTRAEATANDLFGFLADSIKSLLESVHQEEQPGDDNVPFGFTFSFPVQQIDVASGTLIAWTKGFETRGVVGNEIVSLLQTQLELRGVRGRVVALVNDTVGTLATLACSDPRTKIGMIIGTGTNAAYVEKVDRISKLTDFEKKYAPGTEMVINTEYGNFGSGDPTALPGWTFVDAELDADSSNKGAQWLEKIVSGHTMGEVCRRFLVKLKEAGEVWSSSQQNVTTTTALNVPFSFTGKLVSLIEGDLSEDLRLVANVEVTKLGITSSTLEDRRIVQKVCSMVAERAARITACALSAIVMHTTTPHKDEGESNHSAIVAVAVDGSVYEHHPSFRQRLIRALEELGSPCTLTLAKDGSGLGAALVAAAVGGRVDIDRVI